MPALFLTKGSHITAELVMGQFGELATEIKPFGDDFFKYRMEHIMKTKK